MVYFIKKLLGLSTILMLIFILLDQFVFPYNSNVMSSKNSLIDENKKEVEVLILGNSHTYFGLNPSFLSNNAINIANKSRKLETDLYILKKNSAKLENLKYVVLPISYYTLFTGELSEKEQRLYYNFYGLEEYNQDVFKNSLIIHESFNELIDDLFSRKKDDYAKGWRSNSETYVVNTKITNDKIGDINERFSRKSTIDKNLIFLKRISNICYEKHIKLILLLPPYHPDFYKKSKGRYETKILNLIKGLDLESVKIINARTFDIKNDKFFENIDHLNVEGATVFSKKIDSILKDLKVRP